jgi:hypothetical protein
VEESGLDVSHGPDDVKAEAELGHQTLSALRVGVPLVVDHAVDSLVEEGDRLRKGVEGEEEPQRS